MPQVQLNTRVSLETYNLVQEHTKSTGKPIARIVEEALIKYFEEVSPMKKEYHILYAGGTELKSITPEETKEILSSAETRHNSLSEDEKRSIEESLLESDSDEETIDCSECLAVKINGTWHDLPKAYR